MLNVAKDEYTVIRDGGCPTPVNYNVGPKADFTLTKLCEPIQIDRDVYGTAIGYNPLGCVPMEHTRFPSQIPRQNLRLDTCILDGLKTNPYVNDTQNKSVDFN